MGISNQIKLIGRGDGQRKESDLRIVIGGDFRNRGGRHERIQQLLALRPFLLFQHCSAPIFGEFREYIDRINKIEGAQYRFGGGGGGGGSGIRLLAAQPTRDGNFAGGDSFEALFKVSDLGGPQVFNVRLDRGACPAVEINDNATRFRANAGIAVLKQRDDGLDDGLGRNDLWAERH